MQANLPDWLSFFNDELEHDDDIGDHHDIDDNDDDHHQDKATKRVRLNEGFTGGLTFMVPTLATQLGPSFSIMVMIMGPPPKL